MRQTHLCIPLDSVHSNTLLHMNAFDTARILCVRTFALLSLLLYIHSLLKSDKCFDIHETLLNANFCTFMCIELCSL